MTSSRKTRIPDRRSLVRGSLAGIAVSGAGWRAGVLTGGGAVAAAAVGTAVFACGGFPAAVVMVGFFGLSSGLSRIGNGRKEQLLAVASKGDRRDPAQVLANGGIPALLVVAGRLAGRDTFPSYLGALAAVNADTWSTEMGGLSRRPPRSIVSGAVVAPGTSGGITVLGLAGAAGGGVSLGLIGGLARRDAGMLPLGLLAGVGGSLADSLLGATVQRVNWCPLCRVETERDRHACGTRTLYHRGWRWVDNDVVNAMTSSTGAIVGWTLSRGRAARRPAP